MKKKSYYTYGKHLKSFGLSLLFGTILSYPVIGQSSKQSKSAEKPSTSSPSFSTKSREDISKRTKISKYFINPDGTRTAQIGGNYHYKDETGNWQDVDLHIQTQPQGEYYFQSVKNDVKVFFPRTAGSGNINMLTDEGIQFNWWQNNTIKFVNNGTALATWHPSTVQGVNNGQSLTYPQLYPSMSEEFVLLDNGLENNLILHQLTSQISSLPQGSSMQVSHFIPLQNGWIIRDHSGTIKNGNFSSKTFSIQMGTDQQQMFFGQVVLFDAATNKDDAMLIHFPSEKLTAAQRSTLSNHVLAIEHSIRFVNGGIEVTSNIPAAWLKNNNRQYPVTIDPTVTITPTGATGNFYGPLTNWYGFQRHANLYLQSEIGDYGTITALEYNRTNNSGTASDVPVTIQLKSSALTNFTNGAAWNSNTYVGDAVSTFNSTFNVGSTTGWKLFTLSTPFQYTSGNLMILLKDLYGNSGSAKYYNQTTTNVVNRQAYYRDDYTDPGDGVSMLTESRLPEIRITYTSLLNCSGLPEDVNIQPTSLSICANKPFNLPLNGLSLENGITVLWQSSTDGTTWNNIGAASSITNLNVTNGITEETQFRAIIACSFSSDEIIVPAVTISITPTIQCYCEPTIPFNCTDGDLILNVTFENINNTTDCSNLNGYGDFTTSQPTPDINAGQSYPISVQVGDGWTNESVGVWIDYNQNGLLDSLEGEFTPIGTGRNTTLTGTIQIPQNAVGGVTRMRVVNTASVFPQSIYVCGPTNSDENFGEMEDYSVNIIPFPIETITVSTVDDVPAVIATNQGNLQVEAEILPSFISQEVVWSIVTETGNASIDQNGLVTAISNGTVWAKAVATYDNTSKDSLLITITNQSIPIDSIVVNTVNNITALIDVPSGTLAHVATVYPLEASQDVTWSITHETGTGTITNTGVVTAGVSGYVWAKATSVQDVTKMDSLRVTIINHDLGVNSMLKESSISIFPNPTADNINIQSAEKHEDLTMSIIDATGKTVLEEKINANKLNDGHAVNMTKYNSGVYILQLKGKNLDFKQRIIRK